MIAPTLAAPTRLPGPPASAGQRAAVAALAAGWRVSHDPDSRQQEEGEEDLDVLWSGTGPCPGPCAHFHVELKARDAGGRRRHRTDAQRRVAARRTLAGTPSVELLLPDDYDILAWALGLPELAVGTGIDWANGPMVGIDWANGPMVTTAAAWPEGKLGRLGLPQLVDDAEQWMARRRAELRRDVPGISEAAATSTALREWRERAARASGR